MKFVIVLFAVFGFALAAPSTFGLKEDLQEIVALFPREEMRAIAKRYLQTDAEFQRVVAYLQGPEWAKLVKAVASNPSYQKFKKYLTEAGIDVDAIIKYIHDLIAGAKPTHSRATRGVREFLDEIKAIIPKDKIMAKVAEKMLTSADFRELYEKISSDEARDLFDTVRALPEVQRVAKVLREMGVDLDKVLDAIYKFLGWK